MGRYKYVLGLDGGGTKTHAALFDIDGNLVDMLEWGPTNHESLAGGFDELRDEMKALLSSLLKRNLITVDDIVSSAFGMAGVDTRYQHRIISGIIEDLDIKNYVLANDAYLGVKAGCPSGVGICVINGTGCTVAGIDVEGRMIQIGGQGSLTRDVGGGGNIGMEAIRCVYDHLFRLAPYTIMKDMLFERLQINSKFDFMEVMPMALKNGTISASEIGKMVFEAANMGDETAISILEFVGENLGKSVNGALHELNFKGINVIEVVLAGSVNVKGSNPSLINAIKNQVISNNPDKNFKFIILRQPPVAGAVIWALQRTEHKIDNMFEKIVSQFL